MNSLNLLIRHPLYLLSFSLPPIIIASLFFLLGELPDHDYWTAIDQFLTSDGYSDNLSDWIVRSNEHIIPITGFLYALNIHLTHGSNLGLFVITYLFAFVQLFILINCIPWTIVKDKTLQLLSLLVVSFFIFAPAAHYNWIQAFSGVHCHGAQLFSIVSIVLFSKYINNSDPKLFFYSLIFALMSCLTFTSGYPSAGTLLVGAFFFKRDRITIVGTLAMTAILVAIALLSYDPVDHHPSPLDFSLTHAIAFPFVYLGAVFTSGTEKFSLIMALIIGIIGVALFFQNSYALLKRSKLSEAKIWFLIGIFVLGNALLLTIFRGGFGVGMAAASRYKFTPAIFWMSSFILLFANISLSEDKTTKRTLVLTKLTLLALISTSYFIYWPEVKFALKREGLKKLAARTLQDENPNQAILREVITNRTEDLILMKPKLQKIKHIPFD